MSNVREKLETSPQTSPVFIVPDRQPPEMKLATDFKKAGDDIKLAQVASTLLPSGVINPKPVTTTRRFFSDFMTGLRLSALNFTPVSFSVFLDLKHGDRLRSSRCNIRANQIDNRSEVLLSCDAENQQMPSSEHFLYPDRFDVRWVKVGFEQLNRSVGLRFCREAIRESRRHRSPAVTFRCFRIQKLSSM